ncbi:hypothetical protein CXB51_014432 [Gossypium anomalum]|uniref:Uncharacterized protein n=1 Tax=Gossypium anomalum TaxID=47600 RepID=A0A8J6D4U6_9ROSI|nr:hypothetical protein CXB51_014432 [Gossypium anomalum]
MDVDLANLRLLDEEEEAFQEDSASVDQNHQFCLLGYGESFCPFRLQIESSKIVFGWDLSLRAVAWRRGTVVSRWLRQADRSQLSSEKMEKKFQSSDEVKDSESNSRGDLWNQSSNTNLIPLKSNQLISNTGPVNWRNLGIGVLNSIDVVNGPTDLMLKEENDPLFQLEGNVPRKLENLGR